MKCLAFVPYLVITITVSYVSSNESPCVNKQHCAECIQTPSCAWCSQDVENLAIPFKRCNTLQEHKAAGKLSCDSSQLHFPENTVITHQDSLLGPNTLIKPQQVSVKLRPGVPVEIEVEIIDPEHYPLDLYYLTDFTYTMIEDKKFLSQLGNQLGEQLKNLTKRFRQGFGTFIDKETMPYIRVTPDWLENPCSSVQNGDCTRPYGFKHHLSLSDDWQQFSDHVNKSKLSASVDQPEGGFDALMQAIVCNEKIGWSDQARKLIIFATDASFHMAGDGKLGGVIRPNDGQCHLDENGVYTHSLEMDYPSIAHLNQKAVDSSVIVIFAVTEDQLQVYKSLSERIEGSKSALLSADSSNVIDLVVDEYRKITARVQLGDDFTPRYIKVTYFSKCDTKVEEQTNVCQDLAMGSNVKFTVKLELLECPKDKQEWDRAFKIYRVGLPDGLTVNMEMLCDCACENVENKNSTKCGNHGTEKCGLCYCNFSYFGKKCQCNSEGKDAPIDETKGCIGGSSPEICSGRGTCSCGVCECNERDDPSELITGEFCQCDSYTCPQYNGLLCGGNGACICGFCKCNDGWTGSACNCYTKKDVCQQPEDVKMLECNGHGSCMCGKCSCTGQYSGKYCEKCLHETCPTRCSELIPCVQCKIHGNGLYSSGKECDEKCADISNNITPVDVLSRETSTENEVLCKGEDPTDLCSFYFIYGKKGANKDVYIDYQKDKECPPKAPLLIILVGLITTIVLIGICLIIAWKACTVLADRREFAKFDNERQKSSLYRNENPLYQTPVGTYENPTYGITYGKQMK